MAEKMNPEVKAKWVAALRSGEYKQGRNKLRVGDRFCCLGVLCNLHAQEHPSIAAAERSKEAYLGDTNYPADLVIQWAGLPRGNPKVRIGSFTTFIDNHNDDGKSFAQIADAIEEQL